MRLRMVHGRGVQLEGDCAELYRGVVAPLGQCGGGTEDASPYFGTAGASAGYDA